MIIKGYKGTEKQGNMYTVTAVADVICDILTQSIFLGYWGSEDRA